MWVILIVAETISAQAGIGYMTMNAREFLQTDVVLVGILLYALLGKLADVFARGPGTLVAALAPRLPGRRPEPGTRLHHLAMNSLRHRNARHRRSPPSRRRSVPSSDRRRPHEERPSRRAGPARAAAPRSPRRPGQALRRARGARRHRPAHRAGRVRRHRRAQRLRQEHAAAAGRRAGRRRRAARSALRRRARRSACATTCASCSRTRACCPGSASSTTSRSACAAPLHASAPRSARAGGPGRPRRRLAGGAVGRPAPARRAGARAGHTPRLLLLDEPLGALDALTRIEMHRLIESLWRAHGFTALLVTHDVRRPWRWPTACMLIEDAPHRARRAGAACPAALARHRRFDAIEERILARVLGEPETQSFARRSRSNR